ncbi:MAG: NADH-quinone oxidoreductase subunit L [Nocardioidaceae bacterium]
MTVCLLIALPAAAAVMIVGVGHRSTRGVQLLGCVPVAVSWLLALVLAGEHWGQATASRFTAGQVSTGAIPVTPALAVDQLAVSMLVLVTSVALLVQVYSVAFMGKDPRYPSYTALICLFAAAMALVVAADDLFVLLVGWEVMGACSYFLIAHYWEGEPAREGAARAFLMTRLGDVGLLFGIFVAGEAAGTYRISGVLSAVAGGRVGTGEATAAGLLILCGVVGKSAQFPLHSWLPDAMPGPTPISALIHAATMVAAGVYLVARLLPLLELSTVTMGALAASAVVTMVGGACFALAAEDLKRVLAWSTVSQLAYMLAALSLGGFGAGVLHLLSHGAFKALLFLAAGSVITTVGRQRLVELGGLRRAMPLTFVTTTVGLAALAGVPPFVGFFSKDAILGLAAHEAANGSTRAWFVLVGALVAATLTAAYATRVWLLVFFGHRARQVVGMPRPSEPSVLMTAPLVVLAGVSTVGGIVVVNPGFLGVSAEPFHLVALVLSLLAVGLGVGAAYAVWRRAGGDPAAALGRLQSPLSRGLSLDALTIGSVVRVVSLGSRATAGAEADVVSPYVRGTDATMQLAGRGLRWVHGGNISRYLTGVAVGAVGVALLVGLVQR